MTFLKDFSETDLIQTCKANVMNCASLWHYFMVCFFFFFFFYRFDKWKINIMSTFVFWSGLRFYGLFKIESLTWSQISLFLTNNLGKVGWEFIYKNDSKNGI